MQKSVNEEPNQKPPRPKKDLKRIKVKMGQEDRYREANANNMVHLFTKSVSKNSLKWEVGLRAYHPDRSEAFSFTDSKFHKRNIKRGNEENVAGGISNLKKRPHTQEGRSLIPSPNKAR